jgi:GT2 family glycosyltransferase
VLDRVGLFWELLFFGREGEDIALRVLDGGYDILYFPKAVVYHRPSSKNRIVGGKQEYYNLRNSLYIYLVRYPWWMLLFFIPIKIMTSLVRCLKNGYLNHFSKALFDVIRKLPTLFNERHPISNATARRYLKLARKHGPLAWNLTSWIKNKI